MLEQGNVKIEEDGAPDDGERRSGRDRRRHERVIYDPALREVERLQSERRVKDRRSIDSLRTEHQWTAAPEAKPAGLGGALRNKVPSRMKPARLALMSVAVVAGGLAAFVAAQTVQPVAPAAPELVTEVVPEARIQILAATDSIGVGQRLTEASIGWVDWPEGSVLPDYITASATPDALTELVGTVVRSEFFAGDPIREPKLARAAQSLLSAVLDTGKRGVSVSVTAEAASGGFISPSDHVDVVMTRNTGAGMVTETLLSNVRVVAIGGQLGDTGADSDQGDPDGAMFTDQVIATLELDPAKAEVIIGGAAMGRLSLVLRSVTDFSEAENMDQRGANQAIRLTSPFWSNDTPRAQ